MDKVNLAPPARKSKFKASEEAVFVTLQVAAERLCLSEITVRRWSESGILPQMIRRGHRVLLKWSDILRALEAPKRR
jgi:predicted site-specific integrase-resolvase